MVTAWKATQVISHNMYNFSFSWNAKHLLNIFLSMTNKMQHCIILLIIVNALHVSSASYALHQELKSLHAASGGSNNKQVWQIPDAAFTDLSSWWWTEKPLEPRTALTIIKSIIQRCILLVTLKNTLMMHGPMNVKFTS